MLYALCKYVSVNAMTDKGLSNEVSLRNTDILFVHLSKPVLLLLAVPIELC